MLTRRIIPCLDVRDGRVVKGTRFLDLQDVGDPVELARRYEEQGADELVILDITATVEGRLATLAIIERCADELSIPLTVGGGVKAIEDVRRLLAAGADKVAMNSAAVRDAGLIEVVAREFGSQCVVLAIDARRLHLPEGEGRGEGASGLFRPHPASAARSPAHDPVGRFAPTGSSPSGRGVSAGSVDKFVVVIDGGRTETNKDAIAWAREGVSRGAGEILLTSMDRDGTGAGFDLELTRAVARAVAVPVIASGGARAAQDFLDVFSSGEADAALAAGILHRGETTVAALKSFLREKGVEVRT